MGHRERGEKDGETARAEGEEERVIESETLRAPSLSDAGLLLQ